MVDRSKMSEASLQGSILLPANQPSLSTLQGSSAKEPLAMQVDGRQEYRNLQAGQTHPEIS